MDDAELYFSLWEHASDGVGQPFEVVHTGNDDVLHSPILKVGNHAEPEAGAFVLSNVKPQQFLDALTVYRKQAVYRLAADAPVLLHLVVYRIEPHERIDALQRAALPGLHVIYHTVGYRAQGGGRCGHCVHLLKVGTDVTVAHSDAVEAYHLMVQRCAQGGLPLGKYLRLKTAVTVSGRVYIYTAKVGLHLLAHFAIAPVGSVLVLQMGIHLALHRSFKQSLQHRGQNSVIAAQFFTVLQLLYRLPLKVGVIEFVFLFFHFLCLFQFSSLSFLTTDTVY